MRDSDWKTASTLSYIVGGLLFLGYWIAYFYSYVGYFGIIIYPYRDFSYSLMAGGIGFLFLGYYFGLTSKRKTNGLTLKEPTMKIGFCSDCGTAMDSDALYCKKCGKSLA